MMTNKEMRNIEEVAKWVALTYGIDVIKEMATDDGFVKYMNEYNEAMYAAYEKLVANKEAMEAYTESVYMAIRSEVNPFIK